MGVGGGEGESDRREITEMSMLIEVDVAAGRYGSPATLRGYLRERDACMDRMNCCTVAT